MVTLEFVQLADVVYRDIHEKVWCEHSRLFGLTPTELRIGLRSGREKWAAAEVQSNPQDGWLALVGWICALAYDLAEKNGLQQRFNQTLRMAGWHWLAGFRNRHPDISLRKPEPTSKARAMTFNKPQVATFFEMY
ncbi:hypothetical protein QE152_g32418 [Popillia japonica]|uniref:Uncharacterized protein n=1 Tax=Popillia japonica TaxID=7064 RepID=A0AAW1IZP2_POPJA